MNVFEEIERLRASRPFRFHDLDHRRNHFAGFFDHDRIADPDVFAFDFIFVVQGRAGDRAAAHDDGLEHRYGREDSSSPDLDHDVEQACLNSFRCVFVCDRPSRRFGGETEPLALRERIHFHHCAVGLIAEILSDAVKLANCIQNFFNRIGQPPMLVRRQAKFLEQRKNFGVKIDICAFSCAGSVKNNAQRTFCYDFRIEMFEGTGGCVAWVGKQG